MPWFQLRPVLGGSALSQVAGMIGSPPRRVGGHVEVVLRFFFFFFNFWLYQNTFWGLFFTFSRLLVAANLS